MSEGKLIIKAKKAKGLDGHKVFSIRVKDEIVENIDKISESTGRSRNELIGILLEYAIKNCKIEE